VSANEPFQRDTHTHTHTHTEICETTDGYKCTVYHMNINE